MTDISVTYERKFSDGNYGSEGLSMTATGTGVITPPVFNEIVEGLRQMVLEQLARSAAPMVARAAQRELQPPPAREPVPAANTSEDLEVLPF